MSNLSTSLMAVVIAATSIVAAPLPASADSRRICDRSTGECYTTKKSRNDGPRVYRDDRRADRDDRRRNGRDYYRYNGRDYYYRDGRYYDNDGNALAAGVIGFAAGALVGGALANGAYGTSGYTSSDHASRCAATYRSYDPASNTYIGYDGQRHRCKY